MRLLLPVLLLLPILAAPAAATHATGGSGAGDDWIEARFTIVIDRDLATMRLNATLEVHKAQGVSAGSLRSAWQSSGGASAPPVAAAVGVIDKAFDTTINTTFSDATRRINGTRPDGASFAAASTSASSFDPGVVFWKTAVITLPASRTGFAYSAAQVESVLDAGARVVVEHQLRAERGWEATWALRLPAGWAWIEFPSASLVDSAREARVVVDAVDAAAPVVVGSPTKIASKVGKPAAARPAFSDERVEVRADVGNFRDGAAGLPVRATVVAELASVDVAERFGGALPAKVDLPYLSSSGLRALYASGVLGQDDLDAAVDTLETDVKQRLDGAFGGNAVVAARADSASLAAGATGPVRLLAFSNTTKDVGAVEPDVARAVLAGGAVVRANLTLTGLVGARVTYLVGLPAGELAFASATGAETVSASLARAVLDGRNRTAAPTQAVALRIKDPDAVAPTAEDVAVRVRVDLADLEVSLPGALGGDLGAILVHVEARAEISAVAVPDAVKGDIPPAVEIAYLSAATLRALREAGALDDAALADLDREFEKAMADGLASLAPGVGVEGGLDRSTLTGSGPVVLSGRASFRQPLAGGAPTAAALVLQEVTQTFELASLQERVTTYEILLPRGLALTALDARGATSEIGEEGGRSRGTIVVPAGQSTTATITLGVTPGLLWAEFPLVVLAVAVVVVALVALPVWGIVRLVRRKA